MKSSDRLERLKKSAVVKINSKPLTLLIPNQGNPINSVNLDNIKEHLIKLNINQKVIQKKNEESRYDEFRLLMNKFFKDPRTNKYYEIINAFHLGKTENQYAFDVTEEYYWDEFENTNFLKATEIYNKKFEDVTQTIIPGTKEYDALVDEFGNYRTGYYKTKFIV